VLLYRNLDSRTLGVAGAILDRQRVSCGLGRRNVDASAESRPHRLFRFRIDFHGLRIRYAIAKRTSLTRLDSCGRRGIFENLKPISAHSLERPLILSALLSRGSLQNCLIRLRTRIKNPPDIEPDKEKCHGRRENVDSESSPGLRGGIAKQETPSGIYGQLLLAGSICSREVTFFAGRAWLRPAQGRARDARFRAQ